MGGDVFLNPTARVDGDVVCMGGQLHEEDGAVVGGQRVTAAGRDGIGKGRRPRIDTDDGDHRSRKVAGAFVWLVVSLALGWGFAGLAPGRTGAALGTLKREGGASALTGFVTLMLAAPSVVAVSILAALLCITIIGIPVAIAGLFGYFAFLGLLFLWGYVVGAAYLGERLLSRGSIGAGSAAPSSIPVPTIVRSALTGILVIAGAELVKRLLQLVPGLGWLGSLIGVLAWIAFGLLTMVGAGAWLRNEMREGFLARLWRGRSGPGPASPAAGGGPAATGAPGGPTMWTPGVPASGSAPPAPPAPPTTWPPAPPQPPPGAPGPPPA
jgi:hypothetical protein